MVSAVLLRPFRRSGLALSLLIAGLVGAPAASAAPGSTPAPLLWSAPYGIDAHPLDSIACPSSTLCVAVDHSGEVLWSTDPGSAPGTWQAADIDGTHEITDVSCPSTTLCVAVDAAGDVITSPTPTNATSWTVALVDTTKTQNNTDNAGSVLVRGVSCPSTALCVAVDAAGNALVSGNPTGGASAWSIGHVDNNASYGCTGSGLTCQPPLVGVSCPATTLCAAVDFSGNLLTTSNPTAQQPWTSTSTTGGGLGSLWGISCPATNFCATVDGTGRHAITLNPAQPATENPQLLPDSVYGIWCQSATLCLASAHAPSGTSGLLGSTDPGTSGASWLWSSLGGVNSLACLTASECLAADDEGNLATGVSVQAISSGLTTQLLRTRHLPKIATLDRTGREGFVYTSPLPGQVTLTWTVAGEGGVPVVLGSATHRFTTAGTTRLTLALSPAGQRVFKAATKLVTLTATAAFAASTDSVSLSRKLTFRHPPKPTKRGH